jgi:prepilin-type N-terminal cleavage/methylation domain-containing protein
MRRGYALIEMTVVMTVGAVLLGIAVTLLGALLQAERASRGHIATSATLGRLADQFRRDVHAAHGRPIAEKNKAGDSIWRFDLGSGHGICYTAGTEEVVREEWVGIIVLRQESYTLPEEYCAEIAVGASADSRIIRLIIAPNESSMRPGHEIRIDALVDRDRRFAEHGKGRK